MVSQKVLIKNPTGLHLRPAGILCKEAMQYKSLITFRFGDDNTANAKSVLSVLGACIKCGDEIEFVCEGEDEETALEVDVSACNVIDAGYCAFFSGIDEEPSNRIACVAFSNDCGWRRIQLCCCSKPSILTVMLCMPDSCKDSKRSGVRASPLVTIPQGKPRS